MLKKIVSSIFCTACIATSYAQSAPPVQEITKQIIRSVSGYANAISCPGVVVEAKNIAALVPYKSMDNRMEAMYAVLWNGDIGCAGGSGTSGVNLAIVTISTGDSYVVDPTLSSPIADFEYPMRNLNRIVGNTKDTLILEGLEYGPDDANCCPSIKIRATLQMGAKGNWKMTEKRVMPTKK